MEKKKITLALSVALLLILVGTTIAMADTGFIENTEINLAYARDKTSFRYWYEGSDFKQTFSLSGLREYGSDGLSLQEILFNENKVDEWTLTEGDQSLFYEIDHYVGLKRYHFTVELTLEFNHIEILLNIIRWDQEVEGSQLRLTYEHNGQTTVQTLSETWYFKRITVTSTDALGSEIFSYDFLNLALNVSNTVLLILISVLSIISICLTIAYKRKGRCE